MNNAYREDFENLGQYLGAVVAAGLDGNYDRRLQFSAAAGLQQSVPSEGGFAAMPQEFALGIWERSSAGGPILSRTTKQPITMRTGTLTLPAVDETSRANDSRYGGMALRWINEGDDFPEFKPKFGQISFRAKLLGGVVHVTNGLLEDHVAFASWFERTAAKEVGHVVEQCVVDGTGAGRPLGILNADCTIEVAPVSGQASATVVAENISSMVGRFWAGSFESAGTSWLMGVDVFNQLTAQNFSTGAPVVTTEGGRRYILGWPALVGEYTPAVGTRGDIILADLAEYIVSEREFGVPSSFHLKFLSDESSLKIRARLDAAPGWRSAVTAKNSSGVTQSPFIVLGAR